MALIGLLSDTHGMLHPRLSEFFKPCREIWHAGDIGKLQILEQLEAFKPTRAVYGNIDGQDIRIRTQESLLFMHEGVKVLMIHIGGYPGRYSGKARELIQRERPDLFISGHSHILKVMPDKKYGLLHINPGAAGRFGFQKVSSLMRINITAGKVADVEVIELTKW